MFLVTILCAILGFAQGLEMVGTQEGSCLPNIRTLQDVDPTWLVDSLPFISGGSKFHLYRQASTHPRFRKMREFEFYDDICFVKQGKLLEGNSTLFGFGGLVLGNFDVRVSQDPTATIDVIPNNPETSPTDFIKQSVTLTDNKTFAVMVNCWEESNQRSWNVYSLYPVLDRVTENLIEEHVRFTGFSRENVIFSRNENCLEEILNKEISKLDSNVYVESDANQLGRDQRGAEGQVVVGDEQEGNETRSENESVNETKLDMQSEQRDKSRQSDRAQRLIDSESGNGQSEKRDGQRDGNQDRNPSTSGNKRDVDQTGNEGSEKRSDIVDPLPTTLPPSSGNQEISKLESSVVSEQPGGNRLEAENMEQNSTRNDSRPVSNKKPDEFMQEQRRIARVFKVQPVTKTVVQLVGKRQDDNNRGKVNQLKDDTRLEMVKNSDSSEIEEQSQSEESEQRSDDKQSGSIESAISSGEAITQVNSEELSPQGTEAIDSPPAERSLSDKSGPGEVPGSRFGSPSKTARGRGWTAP